MHLHNIRKYVFLSYPERENQGITNAFGREKKTGHHLPVRQDFSFESHW
jgi:hypothetical protein